MIANYKGAIVVEAANYGYGVRNNPKGFVYHTPEEKADDDPQTPRYLAGTTRLASYHYFVSYLGFVFQLVPESEGAYANYVTSGKTYPVWSSSSINLNLQSISVSFEGYAHNIHLTMPRGSSQWNAGVALVANRAQTLNINPDNWARHSDVSSDRGDPGRLNIVAFTYDVKAKVKEEDMGMTQTEKDWARGVEDRLVTVIADLVAFQNLAMTPKRQADIVRLGTDNTTQTVADILGRLKGHADDISKHGGAGGDNYTDAKAVKAVKEALPDG